MLSTRHKVYLLLGELTCLEKMFNLLYISDSCRVWPLLKLCEDWFPALSLLRQDPEGWCSADTPIQQWQLSSHNTFRCLDRAFQAAHPPEALTWLGSFSETLRTAINVAPALRTYLIETTQNAELKEAISQLIVAEDGRRADETELTSVIQNSIYPQVAKGDNVHTLAMSPFILGWNGGHSKHFELFLQ